MTQKNAFRTWYAVLIVLVSALPCTLAKAADEPMNVLLLSVDDMNCDSVGAFGCKVPGTTPNLDALAADSMRFLHAHVHASSCVPSRNIIMTGRYLFNSGVEGFYAVPPEIKENPTQAKFLRHHGYFTMIQGKESHSMPFHPYTEWDIDFGDGRMKGSNTRHPATFRRFTKEGVDAAKRAGKPFYYSINIHDPHNPIYNWHPKTGVGLNAPDRDNPPSRTYTPDEVVVPKFLPDTPKVRQELAAYYSSVRRADDSVGQVIRVLKELDVYDNTIIMFFSDHGMPFPFAKTAMYYHSTHTPLIIRWPGVTSPGAVDDQHVLGTVDLFPTMAEMLSLDPPDRLDGRSFADILRGKSQDDREFVYTMYEENVGGNRQPTRSVISKDFGYIVNLWSDGERRFATATRGMASMREIERLAADGDRTMQQRLDLFQHRVPEEFYHYSSDPDAMNNLIDELAYAKKIEAFRQQAVAMMTSSGDPLLDIYQGRDDAAAVDAYLSALDAESKARKAKPEIYKRGWAAKQVEKKSNSQESPEESQRREKRKQNRLERKEAENQAG